MQSRHAPSFALYALFAGAIAIGLGPILVRWSETGPSATAFWRLMLSLPFFWAWRLMEKAPVAARPNAFSPSRNAALLAAIGLFFAVDLALWHWSIKLTTVANATLFANLAAVLVTFVAWMWLGERLSWPFLIGLVLALGGVGLLVGVSFDLGGRRVWGDALGLLTAVFYAGYIVSVKVARSRLSVPVIMLWSIPVACAALAAASWLSHEAFAAVTARGWATLVVLALTSQLAGQGLIVLALAYLPASFGSVSLLVQPAAAAVFAWFLVGEKLGIVQVFGGALVLAGIYMARTGSRPAAAAEQTRRSRAAASLE
jgi:drug/metabolite transporter (DMT)-like permease